MNNVELDRLREIVKNKTIQRLNKSNEKVVEVKPSTITWSDAPDIDIYKPYEYKHVKYSQEEIDTIRANRKTMYERVSRENKLLAQLKIDMKEITNIIYIIISKVGKRPIKDKYGNVITIKRYITNKCESSGYRVEYQVTEDMLTNPLILNCSLVTAMETLVLNNMSYNDNFENVLNNSDKLLLDSYEQLMKKKAIRYLLEVRDVSKFIKEYRYGEPHIPTEEEIKANLEYDPNKAIQFI